MPPPSKKDPFAAYAVADSSADPFAAFATSDATETLPPERLNFNNQWVREGVPAVASGLGGMAGFALTKTPQGARGGAALGGMAGQGLLEALSPVLGSQGPPEGITSRILKQGAIGGATEMGGQALARGVGAFGKAIKETAIRPTSRTLQKFPRAMETIEKEGLRIGDVSGAGGSDVANQLVSQSAERALDLSSRSTKLHPIGNLAHDAIKAAEKRLGRPLIPSERNHIRSEIEKEARNILGRRTFGAVPFSGNRLSGRDVHQLAQMAGEEASALSEAARAGLPRSSSPELVASLANTARKLRNRVPGVREELARTQGLMGARRALRVAETTNRGAGIPLPFRAGPFPITVPLPVRATEMTGDFFKNPAVMGLAGQVPRVGVGAFRALNDEESY